MKVFRNKDLAQRSGVWDRFWVNFAVTVRHLNFLLLSYQRVTTVIVSGDGHTST